MIDKFQDIFSKKIKLSFLLKLSISHVIQISTRWQYLINFIDLFSENVFE